MAGMVLTFSAASEQLDLSAKRSVVLRDLEGSTPSLGAEGCVREGGGERRDESKIKFIWYVCTGVREREREHKAQ